MDRSYWDKLAGVYDARVLNSLEADRDGVIGRAIDELADGRRSAADFGCGTGHYLPALAERFKRVVGIDHSRKLLDAARRRIAKLANASVRQGDLADRAATLEQKVDLGFCMNVLIMPDRQVRRRIGENLARWVRKGGRLLLLVPALESALYVNQRYVSWNVERGVRRADAKRAGLHADGALLDGIVPLDGAPTKHYLAAETRWTLGEWGFEVDSVQRVAYDWQTEFAHPPRWLGEPYPWDWLVSARRHA